MAYVATRGGAHANEQSQRLYKAEKEEITPDRVAEIRRAMPYLIDRVMGQASLYDLDLAALALAQTGG
jgi:alpha-D-ribose 1-methylphosphonate 5-triphosphate synthase subunit PhnI